MTPPRRCSAGRTSRTTPRAARHGQRFAPTGTEMAVAGFVLSVLWLFFLGSLAGLCLGSLGRRRLAAERAAGEQAPPTWADEAGHRRDRARRSLARSCHLLWWRCTLLHVVNITAACHPAVAGQTCSLIVRR